MSEVEKITRRTFLRNCAIATGASMLTAYSAYYFSSLLQLTHLKIDTKKLSKPLKALQFSDLHLDVHLTPEILRETIETIMAQNVDFIFFTGDAITHHPEYAKIILEMFPKLKSNIANFAVIGNHDYLDGAKSKKVEKYLNDSGFKVLRNKSRTIDFKGENINIFGLDDLWHKNQDVPGTLGPINKDQFNLVLTHHPTNIEEISKYNPDIVLAGHTHGGQIYIPYLLNGIYKNIYDPRFIRGHYKVNNTELYVNRGIGSTLTKMRVLGHYYKIPAIRLFARPEITLFTIT